MEQVFVTKMSPEDFKVITSTLEIIDRDAGNALVELCKRHNRCL